MNRHVQKGLQVLVTLLIVAAAGFGARWLWIRYNLDPWTRDGRLRADVVLALARHKWPGDGGLPSGTDKGSASATRSS